MSLEEEKEQFKSMISSVLDNANERFISEKDFKKAYHSAYNHNINIMIDKFDAGNVYNFLRFQCKSICEITANYGEIKIQRIHNEISSPPEAKKKRNKKSSLPKVNNPRTGIINENSFPRLNPQGFNKNKPKQEHKPLTSLPFYNTKYTATYRSVEQLGQFQGNVADEEDEAENARVLASTVKYYGPQRAPNFGTTSASELENYPQVLCEEIEPAKVQALPKVGNPFDFPALPTKEEEKLFEESGSESDFYESNEDGSNDGEPAATATISKLLKMQQEPAKPPAATITTVVKTEHRFVVDLDDAIFRSCLPDVVEDPDFKIPSPKLHFMPQQLTFEVQMSTIHSPDQFYFLYGDHLLCSLINQMNEFYSGISHDDLVMSAKSLQPGMVAAVAMKNNWYRAEIVSKPDQNGFISLFLVDFGVKIRVNSEDARYLPKMFTRDPVKALRGAIIDISSKYKEDNWNSAAREVFFETVRDRKMKATIRNYREVDNVYELQLFGNFNYSWHNIGNLMIERGYAATRQIEDICPYALPLSVPQSCVSRAS